MNNTMRPKHESIVYRLADYYVKFAVPEIIYEGLRMVITKFELAERIKKLQPGDQIDIRIKRHPLEHGGHVEVRVDDRFTGHASTPAAVPAMP